MRITLVYHAAATENAKAIFRALAQVAGNPVDVIVPTAFAVHPVYEKAGLLEVRAPEQGDGFRLWPVPLRNPYNCWWGFDSALLYRALRERKPHLVHVLDEPMSGYLYQVAWLALGLRPRPKVLFYAFENLPIRFKNRRHRLKWRLTWRLLAGGVAANTEAIERAREAGFPAAKPVERIFWGIPSDVFAAQPREDARRSLGVECPRAVGFVGRLSEEKGLKVFLAALQRLPREVHALIVGAGPMEAELELWAGLPGLQGRAHLCGLQPPAALAQYLKCMDVLALPSLTTPHWKEQYGRVIAEAMACGVPVVGSDSGAIPEVIGPAGLVAPEGDAAALAAALQRVLFDDALHAKLREEALKRSREELSADAMARRLWAFYQQVVRRRA